MKFPLPMRVQPPPPGLPTWIDANSRITLSSPITSAVFSPDAPSTCGSPPITAKEEMRVREPTLVRPVTVAWEATTTPGAELDVLADHRVGPDLDVRGELRPRVDDRGRVHERHARLNPSGCSA